MKPFSARPGLPVGLSGRRPAIGPDVRVEAWSTRALGALADVAATPVRRSARQIQYWMLNGIVRAGDAARVDPALSYELTYMADRPIGWERPKSMGHAHSRPAPRRPGYAEVCEVLEGLAGFIVQDLGPGPSATFAALVTARPGERVVLPPLLQHASVNLAGDPMVFSDVISRAIRTDYAPLASARGMTWLIDLDGIPRANPEYTHVPELLRFTAEEWSGPAARPLYSDYVEDPGSLDWIGNPDLFPERVPLLWARIEEVIARLEAS